jgi:hypothetical protein
MIAQSPRVGLHTAFGRAQLDMRSKIDVIHPGGGLSRIPRTGLAPTPTTVCKDHP